VRDRRAQRIRPAQDRTSADSITRDLPTTQPTVTLVATVNFVLYGMNQVGVENSHQLTRQRERAMKRFTSPRHAQRFLSAFSGISPHFRPRRHLLRAVEYRREMDNRFATWNEVAGLSMAP
jgi:transposase-like protein